TFQILSGVILGGSLEARFAELFREINEMVDLVPTKSLEPVPTPFWLPTPLNRRFLRSATRFRRILSEIVSQADSQADGLLAALISQPQSSRSDTLDILATMLLAGFETTANGLSWIVALLATHPQAQEQL